MPERRAAATAPEREQRLPLASLRPRATAAGILVQAEVALRAPRASVAPAELPKLPPMACLPFAAQQAGPSVHPVHSQAVQERAQNRWVVGEHQACQKHRYQHRPLSSSNQQCWMMPPARCW